jgi:hypothetical protein
MRILTLAALLGLSLTVESTSILAQSRTIVPEAKPGTPATAAFYADSWAVVIGINDYQHPRIPKLRYAVNDARSVEQTLLAQGFRRDRIITLVERQATKAAIERVLGDQLRTQMGSGDRLFVFFAGHGKTDRLRSGEQEGYLLPADGDPSQLFSTAISMESLRRISDRLPAKHILYVVDACYSGYAIYSRSISEDLLEEMVKKPAIQILTAGRQGDEAQERGGHGVFTDVLIRGLQGDAFSGKGWLALEELGLWVKQRVYAESGRKQVPQYGNLSGEGQFVFLRPGAKVDIEPLRSKLQVAIAAPSPARSPILVEAASFVRPLNVAVGRAACGNGSYGAGVLLNVPPCGHVPNAAEFDFDATAGGIYHLASEYAAAESRPVRIFVNGQLVSSSALAATTGCWTENCQSWHNQGQVQLRSGRNTMRIERDSYFPHIRRFRFEPAE